MTELSIENYNGIPEGHNDTQIGLITTFISILVGLIFVAFLPDIIAKMGNALPKKRCVKYGRFVKNRCLK